MIVASYILHYGKEWLKWSIRSVIDQVDQVHLFYTPFPSHGHGTTLLCPETRDDIRNSIFQWLNNYKVYWHDCRRFVHEGDHRSFAVNTCAEAGADTILVVDADELWDSEVLKKALLTVQDTDGIRSFRIGMRHFWRSVKFVCDDAAMPTRIIKPAVNSLTEMYLGDEVGKVYHMGYAQSPSIIRYKMEIHGHKAEWRPEWYKDRFMAWGVAAETKDMHPTNYNYWNPVATDPDTMLKLEAICYDHPYLKLDIIV